MIKLRFRHAETEENQMEYDFLESIDFHENFAKTPGNLDSRLQVSQFFHADACVDPYPTR